MTSSPTWSTTSWPASSNARTAAPSARPWSSPRYTGSVGTPPTTAVPLDDRLGRPGRARRVEDPGRVVEGDRLEARLGVAGQQLVPGDRAVQPRVLVQVGQQHGVLDAGDLAPQAGHRLQPVEVPA